MGIIYGQADNGSSPPIKVATDGSLSLARLAGERQPESTSGAGHMAVAAEGAVFTVAYGDGDTVIWDGPGLLYGYKITTALSAHSWTIDDNASARITIPASSTVGVYTLPCAVIFETNITINVGASASAGVVEFFFRPLDPDVSWAY